MYRFLAWLALPLLVVCRPVQCAPAQVPEAASPTVAKEEPSYSQEGIASWYGNPKGHKTANGEPVRPHALTAANRSLPFNTMVRVTNLQTGKSVKVRINDRGPFAKGRIIDLSRDAARLLGMIKQRIAKVRVEVFAADQDLRQSVRRAVLAASDHGKSQPRRRPRRIARLARPQT